jgi:site-specific DNA-methyltransferase (adenine-specific)
MLKQLKTVSLADMKPYANNPRHNDGAVDAVKESIRQCNYIAPIIVDEDNIILAGHTRYKALQALGKTEAEVMIVTGLTEEQKKKYRLLDNKTNEMASWDIDLLEVELEDIDFEGFDFGFEVTEIEPEIVEDDYDEEAPTEPRVKLGDLWQLGDHRLICGDSTDVNVIERLVGGVQADLVLTDPPYGINAVADNGEVGADFGVAKKGKYKEIIADDTTETAEQAYNLLSQICDRIIMWGGNYFLNFLPPSTGWIVWDKRVDSGIRNTFADGEMAYCNFHTPVRIYHQLWNGMIREGEHEKRVHPTQKPVQMLGQILKDFSSEGDDVVDIFGGSGSTLIACEQLNRKCFMCELDEHYCDVIIDRWEQFTGQKAVLINE